LGQPRPVLLFAQALLAAIAARDPAVAPIVDTDQAARASSEQVVVRLEHPSTAPFSRCDYFVLILGGMLVLGLFAWMITDSSSFFVSAPDPAVASLHNPLLIWLSAHRFVLQIDVIFLSLTLGVFYVTLWLLITRRYMQIANQGMTAQVDARGIHAQFLSAHSLKFAARWDAVTGFARLRYRDEARQNCDVYLLLAGERVLLWESQPGDELVVTITRYAPVPLVQISKILRASNRGQKNASAPMNWNPLSEAALLAPSENEMQLWRAIWEKRHPGKPAARTASQRSSAFFAGFMTPIARANVIRAAKALLAYYPTPNAARTALRTRFLSRSYMWFSIAVLGLLCVYVVSDLAFMLILYNQR
jgi:hypothetical protein